MAGSLSHFAGIGAALSWRERNGQQILCHIVSLRCRQSPDFLFIIGESFVRKSHCRCKSAIDQMTDAADRITFHGIWFHAGIDVGAVVASVWVAGNSVPMIRLGVAQSANGHRRTRHDLIATGYNGSFQNPQQLIGVTIGMTTRTGECSGGRSCCRFERHTASLHRRVSRVVQHDSGRDTRCYAIREIHQTDGIRHRVQHPCGGKPPFGLML